MSEFCPDNYRAAREGVALFDTSARGKIVAEGNDAVVFLHNLSTNDIKKLAPNAGCELFFCTATAKVVAHGRVYREPPQGKRERLWLDVGAGQGPKLFAHLDRYIIGEDVTLSDQTQLAQFHLCGPGSLPLLKSALGWSAPEGWGAYSVTSFEGLMIRESRLVGIEGFDVLCPVEIADAVKAKFALPVAPTALYEILRIEAGLPEFGIDLDESTFAPEVGRTGAISYQKGCYLGQEPIVMARDRGVVQRTLIGLLAEENLPHHSPLFTRDGKEVGRVTSCVHSPRLGVWIALAYARRGSQTPGTELETDVAGARRVVKVAKLPFGA